MRSTFFTPRSAATPHAFALALTLTGLSGLLGATGCETSPPVGPDPAAHAPDTQAQTQAQGAARAAPGSNAAAEVPAGLKKTYGEPLSATSPKVALSELLKTPGRYADKTVRIEGKVSAVCQAKGCWLELEDEGGMAHVKLGAHRFFVPKTANGQHAVVEGKVFAQVDKGHCEQEAEEQTGKVAKVELDATGVELTAVR